MALNSCISQDIVASVEGTCVYDVFVGRGIVRCATGLTYTER